ncbi:MAG: M15 family metallopeptidase [Woeseiaceae bacterium]
MVMALFACHQQPQQALDAKQQFVSLAEVIPNVVLDVRYYSSDNFVGARVDGYRDSVVLLSQPAADALQQVQAELNERGLGLKIFDGYRPQKAVDHFVRWSEDPSDVMTKEKYYPELPKDRLFELGYIARKSGHTRGSTVDLTIVELQSGAELEMGSPWDFFGEISHHDSALVGEEATRNRNLLRDVMVRHGFKPYANEWWHYTLADEPFPDTYFDFDVE